MPSKSLRDLESLQKALLHLTLIVERQQDSINRTMAMCLALHKHLFPHLYPAPKEADDHI